MRDALSSRMPQQPPGDGDTAKPRSTDRGGAGQSGYTAGRHAGDAALGIANRNQTYADRYEDHRLMTADDRFTGRGGESYDKDRVDRERRGTDEDPARETDGRAAKPQS